MSDVGTKRYAAVVPGGLGAPVVPQPLLGWAATMVKNLLIAAGDEFETAEDFCFSPDGHYLCAAKRKEGGLWVVLHFTPTSAVPVRSVPYRKVLGLTLAGSEPPQPFYVGFPEEGTDNRPRVYWGKSKGDPFDAIDHEELQWADGEPLYPAYLDGKAYVIQGTRRSEPADEVIPPLSFVAGRPLWRGRFGTEIVLSWGTAKSKPCDHISEPTFNGREIVAGAVQGTKLYRLTFRVSGHGRQNQ